MRLGVRVMRKRNLTLMEAIDCGEQSEWGTI